MKIFILSFTFFFAINITAQKEETITWINSNLIKIEDANPDTKLLIFNNYVPKKFQDAKIFGFGEATHHGKEFFDIKAKFFKYLVEKQNVKVFIIEDSYPSEIGINEWISGGKGEAETIAYNFSIAPWQCKEVVNLLEWMRNYNLNKAKEDQIRFFGMDIQIVENINQEIRHLVKNYNIPISEELLLLIDKCVEKKVDYIKSTDWADIQIPKLNEIKVALYDFQKSLKYENNSEFNSAIRALDCLIKYTYYVENHYRQDRDLMMFENAKWIVENKSNNGKAFIWAHNEHINNKGFGSHNSRNIYNLGRHLKEYYKEDYFSVGFDFGKGALKGYIIKKDEPITWKTYQINEPFPDTYAATLYKAKDDIFFIDISKAVNDDSTKFFKKKNQQVILGGPGYLPEENNFYTKLFSEMYDGLIFVKNISVPNYKLKEK
jgi:erythromycin esterase